MITKTLKSGFVFKVTILFVLTAISSWSINCKANESTKLSANQQNEGPQKLALLIGINDYKSPQIRDLNGCLNDVERIKTLLLTKYEFPEENILTLANEQATHDAIINSIKNHLIARAKKGDIVVLSYSGHGSNMKDISGDEIDNLDETIVPYDSRTPNKFDIRDDQINGMLRDLTQKTANVTLIMDCCCSGANTRAAEMIRNIPTDDREPPPQQDYELSTRNIGDGESGFRNESLNYVAIAACRADERASEYSHSGKSYGMLTYFLTEEIETAGSSVTYRDVLDNVRGNVNAINRMQHPQLEGANADNYLFSEESSIPQPYVLASPHSEDKAKVILKGGRILGFTDYSIFEIYAPNTKKFQPPNESIAKVEITNVKDKTSEAIYLSGNYIPAKLNLRLAQNEEKQPAPPMPDQKHQKLFCLLIWIL